MAYGEIHNSTGTVCKAHVSCPLEDGGHSADVDGFIAHQESLGLDGRELKRMISDGTPIADALEVLKLGKSGMESTAKSNLPGTRTMKSTGGYSIEVTPGVIDDNAKKLYREGQCLAFATELAEKTGGKVVLLKDVEGNLLHAYSYKSGKLYDIEGSLELNDLKSTIKASNKRSIQRNRPDIYRSVSGYSPRKLRKLIASDAGTFKQGAGYGNIHEQDFELARTFVDSYTEQAEGRK